MTPLRNFLLLLRWQTFQALRSPLVFLSLLCLLALPPAVGMVFGGSIQINGHAVGESFRLSYAYAIGYSLITFMSTLFCLCLCLERTGSSYLRHHDLLILARPISRTAFFIAKMGSILLPVLAYSAIGLFIFAEEIWRKGGIVSPQILFMIFPLALNLFFLISAYFCLRNRLGNFLIFFLGLLTLPILYVGGLWHTYGGMLREPGSNRMGWFECLPQLGELHAYALGHLFNVFWKEGSFYSLVNLTLWSTILLGFGLWEFQRKRL